jgi:peptidoglycan LD-endopeptidase LytH
LYGYAGGDPINFSDPFGLTPFWENAVIALNSVSNPTGGAVRGCDPRGCGHHGAPRDGGTREHEGTDYNGEPGQGVNAVISGTVRVGRPYANNEDLRFIEITRWDGLQSKQLYNGPLQGIRTGSVVISGQPIGTQQDIRTRYPGITNHTHVEMRQGGRILNASTLVP